MGDAEKSNSKSAAATSSIPNAFAASSAPTAPSSAPPPLSALPPGVANVPAAGTESVNMSGGLKIGVRKDLMPNSSSAKPAVASTAVPPPMSPPIAPEAQV